VLGLNIQHQITKPSRKWITPAPSNASGIVVMGKKVYVQGMVKWKSQLKITLSGNRRIFKGNGLPATPTGTFPVQKNTAAYNYYSGAPAVGYKDAAAIPIKAWDLSVSLPRYPKVASKPRASARTSRLGSRSRDRPTTSSSPATTRRA